MHSANHSFFNRQWLDDDGVTPVIARSSHERILDIYGSALFRSRLLGHGPTGIVYLAYRVDDALTVDNHDDRNTISVNSLGRPTSATGGAAARTTTVSRLHRLLLELIPGGAKQFLSAAQARTLLATVRPRDPVGKIRRQLAAELITELAALDKKIKAADSQLKELLAATGTGLLALPNTKRVEERPDGGAERLTDVGRGNRHCSTIATW